MSGTEEATVNPDGSTTFEAGEGTGTEGENFSSETDGMAGDAGTAEEFVKGIDPAVFLLLAVVIGGVIWFLFYQRRRKAEEEVVSFFEDLDGQKFNLKLPAAVEEYYEIKQKCLDSGWVPGQDAGKKDSGNGPNRIMAQALMKRCIADIPIVTHIQKESPGMNKLYSQSMCSVKQWKSYQAAETLVSAEVDEVRAEADEIEPGWSQVIWRQAMQYHNMLKQRHEMEAKAAAAQAEKKKKEDAKVAAEKKKEEDAKAREVAAEKAAQELIKAEEREKESKKAFKDGGMKKGFLKKK